MSAPRRSPPTGPGLTAIVCVGETREEREAGKTLSVVRKQLRGSIPVDSNSHNLVVAYEPVWAIGTGLTPTVADVAEVHALIRDELRRLVGKAEHARVRILYGGSVKPSNAAELMAVENVNGALVGGASLVAADFLGIAGAYLARHRARHRLESGAHAKGSCGSLILRPPMLQAAATNGLRAADALWRSRLRFLETMQTVLIIVHLIIVLALIGVVLLQRSEGGGMGLGGGGGGGVSGFMTGRGQANALTRATAILAALFFVTSIALTIMATSTALRARFSTARRRRLRPGQQAPAAPQGGNVLEQLQRLQGEQPAAPSRRSGSGAPRRRAAGASVQ